MPLFVARRLLQAVPILLGVSVLAFLLVRLVPGDIADILAPPGAPPAVRAQIAEIYGLDRPLWVQYGTWARELLSGNFGVQMVSGRPIAPELFAAVSNTLKIAVAGGVLGFGLGILLGALAAKYDGRWPDALFSVLVVAGVSVPNYWLAMLLVSLFAVELNWLPAQGMGPPGLPLSWDQWRYMLMPVAALAMIPMGMVGRLVRAAVLEVLSQEFVGALIARGLTRRHVVRHVARNVAPPVLAVMGLQFGYLLGGSILIETVFNWPGTGQLLNRAIFGRDLPTIQGTLLVLAALFVLVNLAVDVAQAALDPEDAPVTAGTAAAVAVPSAEAAAAEPRRRFRVLRRLLRNKPALCALAVLTLVVLLAAFAPWITTGEPYRGSALRRLRPIGTPGHWLGTDEVGRDMWTRLAYGGRLSLLSGILPVLLALGIGGSLGVLAGYVGGWVNAAVMRTMDVFYAFPSVLVAIGVGAVLGAGFLNTVVALTVVFVPPFVRVVESVTTRVRNSDYVEAARTSGAGALAVIRHHVLRNVAGPVLVYAASMAGLSIILAAGLSFLGLGLPPPNAEWGQMLNSLRQSIYVAPWLAALPGAMIFVTSVSLNLVSDGLRAALDVK